MNFFERDTQTALEAKEKAQWIAFAPVVFQVTRVLRETGILSVVSEEPGLTQEQIIVKTSLPEYGVRVLLEGALGIGLLIVKDEKYYSTKLSFFVMDDDLTRVNMDFIHDVCYK